MCGIAGRFHPTGLPSDRDWRRRADTLLAHRGPDGSGHYSDDICELVHRRLAIIDLTTSGDQPMSNEDGNVLVVFNGEIYNHTDLRRDLLARGHRFRGTSDTEVLVHLYEEDGAGLVKRLRGMFALAIYDRRRRSLLLARDRFGIKPLYYAAGRDQVIFASEIKGILAAQGAVRRLDHQACYDFLSLGYVPEPASGFTGIRMLAKGGTLLIDALGEHHSLLDAPQPDPERDLDEDEAQARVEQGLLKAAEAQSHADVPVAALLSGGIDSSLVVAALCRATGRPPTTFNVRFPEAGYDETDMAVAVARRYGTEHHTIDVDRSILSPDTVLDLLRHFDQPFADSSLLPTYAVCRAIRAQGFACTVSGDGGDEAFGGYESFRRMKTFGRLMRWPAAALSALETFGRALTPFTADAGRQIAKAALLARRGRDDTSVLMAALYSYLNKEQKEQLVRRDARDGLLDVGRCFGPFVPPETTDLELLSLRLTHVVFANGLASDMLRKVDMMSMRVGLEVRVPMLDEEVVATGLRLPHGLKADGRSGKLVLRRLATRWLPPEVAVHGKQGFTIPLDRMVDKAFHDMLADFLLSEGARVRRLMDMALVHRWLEWFRLAGEGRRSGALSRIGIYQRIFILLALEVWLREQALEW